MKNSSFFNFFSKICFYGYFVGLINLTVCLFPYILLDWILIIPAYVSYVFPLGSFVGIIPYGFFRWDTPISYQKVLDCHVIPYYLLLISAISLQIYVLSQILKNKIFKVYNIILLHHFGVGLFYLTNFTIFSLINSNMHPIKIIFGAYGFMINMLTVIVLRASGVKAIKEGVRS